MSHEDLREYYECNGKPHIADWLDQADDRIVDDVLWEVSRILNASDLLLGAIDEAVNEAYADDTDYVRQTGWLDNHENRKNRRGHHHVG